MIPSQEKVGETPRALLVPVSEMAAHLMGGVSQQAEKCHADQMHSWAFGTLTARSEKRRDPEGYKVLEGAILTLHPHVTILEKNGAIY